MRKIRKECPYCEQIRIGGKDMTVEREDGYEVYICEKCGYEMDREKIKEK